MKQRLFGGGGGVLTFVRPVKARGSHAHHLCPGPFKYFKPCPTSLFWGDFVNSWADLVEELVPQAVASAIEANKGMRSGLPRDYLDYTGVVHSDKVNP